MLFMFILICFLVFLVFVFYVLNFFIGLNFGYLDKNMSFECGFESIGKIHSSFSIHFFIVMLMFVIFDLEVVMLFGLLMGNYSFFLCFLVVLFFVFLGFYMEWYFGKLAWLV